MKILYLTDAQWHDYLPDLLLHGLRSLLGPDCVDVNRIDFMYQGTEHGGYTVYGLLPNIAIDRDDIENKISSKFFDLIVYGSIRRCDLHWKLVVDKYPASRIFMLDGEDTMYDLSPHLGSGVYWKRELPDDGPYAAIQPIGFCLPAEKIVDSVTPKTRLMAPLIPGDLTTYGYGTEQCYRDMYAESQFGRTKQKAGWDCLRHYEILMMGTVPYFENLEACPRRTCNYLPKAKLLMAKTLYEGREANPQFADDYEEMADWLLSYTKQNLTTTAMAQHLLDYAVRSGVPA